jgi:hypothetical protein
MFLLESGGGGDPVVIGAKPFLEDLGNSGRMVNTRPYAGAMGTWGQNMFKIKF